MNILRQIDPDGVAKRRGKRLKRRSYHCKVLFIWNLCDNYKFYF